MTRTRWAAVVAAAAATGLLAACNRTPTPELRLEPTRTLAPRSAAAAAPAAATEPAATATAPEATAEPQPDVASTPQPVTGLTLRNVNRLAPVFGIQEPPPQHIFAVADDRLTLYNASSFEVVDPVTLDVLTRSEVQVRNEAQPGFWYAASPDGRWGAIMTLDGKVDIYDLDSSIIVTTVQVPEPSFDVASDVALNEDGSRLVAVSQGDLRVIDLGSGAVISDSAQTLPANTQLIRFSEDGSRLAAAQLTGEIVVVNALSGAPAITLADAFTDTQVQRLNFSPNGAFFGASDNDSLVIWDLREELPLVIEEFSDLGASVEPVIDREGRHLAVVASTSVFVYDLRAKEAKGEYRLTRGVPVWSANFDRAGRTLFIAGSGDLASFDVIDGQPVESSTRPPLTRAAFTSDGRTLATWSTTYQSPDVALLSLGSGGLNRRLPHESPVRWATFGPEGDTLATLTFGGTLRVWEAGESVIEITSPQTDTLRAILCFTADGQGLAYLEDDKVVVHDIARDRTASDFALPFTPNALSVCTNEQRTIAASDGEGISIFNLDGEVLTTLSKEGEVQLPVGALYFSRDGSRLAALSPRQLTIWDVTAGTPLQEISLQRAPMLGLFNADGSKFALNFGDDVDVVDVATGDVTTLDLPPGSVVSLLVPRDPDLIVTTAMLASPSTAERPVDERNFVTGNLSAWDAQTGELVRSIETDEPIFTSSISDDGARIATSTRQNGLTIWALEE